MAEGVLDELVVELEIPVVPFRPAEAVRDPPVVAEHHTHSDFAAAEQVEKAGHHRLIASEPLLADTLPNTNN